jgi:PAS domain-containing protein
MKNTHNKSDSEILRQKAEELLKKKSAGTASPFSEVESIRLIHELKVHQVELEMQNDELQRARAIAEVANDKYIRLYDFAPSGYFTLSDKGEIIELNLSGAKMLGKDRQHLKNSLLGFLCQKKQNQSSIAFLKRHLMAKSKNHVM